MSNETTGQTERLNPESSYVGLFAFVGIALSVGGIVSMMQGEISALIFVAVGIALPVCFLGIVDLTPETITVRKVTGTKSYAVADVADVGMTYRRSKSTKWWLPTLTMCDGTTVKLGVLSTVRRKRCTKSCQKLGALVVATRRRNEEQQRMQQPADVVLKPLAELGHR